MTTWQGLIVVALGGAIGACLRALVYRGLAALAHSAQWIDYPRGTMLVNAVGSALLGTTLGLGAAGRLPPISVALVAIGLCGSLTTFSTFVADLEILIRRGRLGWAVVHVVSNFALSVGAAALALLAVQP